MILHDLYKILRADLSEPDARYVLRKRGGIEAIELIIAVDKILDSSVVKLILEDVALAKQGKPLSRIYNEREFWGLDFMLSDATLDPRQDTETLIEAVLARYKDNPPDRILDLGTGSGCILIALLSEFKDAHGVGVDLSAEAVKAARNNAHINSVEDRSEFICSSWGDEVVGEFDLIVSNPPYISNQIIPNLDENVRKFDPILALDGGDDGLQAYKEIFLQLPSLLKKGGYAFLEIGYDQAESVMRLSRESRFNPLHVHLDSQGMPRVVENLFE